MLHNMQRPTVISYGSLQLTYLFEFRTRFVGEFRTQKDGSAQSKPEGTIDMGTKWAMKRDNRNNKRVFTFGDNQISTYNINGQIPD